MSFTLNVAGGGTVGEGAGNAMFTVTVVPSPVGAALTEEITVDWRTEDGTAKAGSDYVTGGGTLTFASGASGAALTKQVMVAISDDMRDEDDETFTVELSNASGAGARIGTRLGHRDDHRQRRAGDEHRGCHRATKAT